MGGRTRDSMPQRTGPQKCRQLRAEPDRADVASGLAGLRWQQAQLSAPSLHRTSARLFRLFAGGTRVASGHPTSLRFLPPKLADLSAGCWGERSRRTVADDPECLRDDSGPRMGKCTITGLCAALRAFFSYLHREGRLPLTSLP